MTYHKSNRRQRERKVFLPADPGSGDLKRLIKKEVLPLIVRVRSLCKEILENEQQLSRDVEVVAQAVSRLHASASERRP